MSWLVLSPLALHSLAFVSSLHSFPFPSSLLYFPRGIHDPRDLDGPLCMRQTLWPRQKPPRLDTDKEKNYTGKKYCQFFSGYPALFMVTYMYIFYFSSDLLQRDKVGLWHNGIDSMAYHRQFCLITCVWGYELWRCSKLWPIQLAVESVVHSPCYTHRHSGARRIKSHHSKIKCHLSLYEMLLCFRLHFALTNADTMHLYTCHVKVILYHPIHAIVGVTIKQEYRFLHSKMNV